MDLANFRLMLSRFGRQAKPQRILAKLIEYLFPAFAPGKRALR